MNKSETTQLLKIISNASMDDLRLIADMVSDRKGEMALMNKYTLRVGQTVWVNHPRLNGIKCVIKEIKRTKALVRTDNASYTVPLSFIEKIK